MVKLIINAIFIDFSRPWLRQEGADPFCAGLEVQGHRPAAHCHGPDRAQDLEGPHPGPHLHGAVRRHARLQVHQA